MAKGRKGTPEPILRADSRAKWRAWLRRHHATAREIWLVYAKKHTGRPRVSYDEAVEEALCFGWIDASGSVSTTITSPSASLPAPTPSTGRRRTSNGSTGSSPKVA